jgi:hypothetical protein
MGAVILLIGCQSKPPTTQPAPEPASEVDYARFLPYPQATALALDTKTGLLCHTFDEERDTVSGNGEKTLLPGQHLLDSIPQCIDLSQNEERTLRRIKLANLGLPDDNK